MCWRCVAWRRWLCGEVTFLREAQELIPGVGVSMVLRWTAVPRLCSRCLCHSRVLPTSSLTALTGGDKALVEVKSAAQYMHFRRTFIGLESSLTGAPVQPVVKAAPGRSGRAAHYSDEPAHIP